MFDCIVTVSFNILFEFGSVIEEVFCKTNVSFSKLGEVISGIVSL